MSDEQTRHMRIELPLSQTFAIALSVRCPDCGVAAGRQCEARGSRELIDRPHWWRAAEGVLKSTMKALEELES